MSTTTKRTTFLVLLLTTIAVFATACSSGDDDEDAQDSESNEADSSTTSESTTTTIPAEGPPEWVEVAQGVEDGVAELLENPDPDRVRDLFAEECACYQQVLDDVQGHADRGTHVEGEPYRVVWVRVENSEDDGAVRFSVRTATTQISIIDENGEVLDQSSADEVGVERCWSTLVRPDGPDGAFRVHDLFQLQGCPEGS